MASARKRKEDDSERIETFNQDFNDNGEAFRTEAAGYTNTMASIIRDAAEQLDTTTPFPGEFKLIWFAAKGQNAQLQVDQFRSTLYGQVDILTATAGKPVRVIPGFYYTFNEFYKLPQIDGAIGCFDTLDDLYLKAHAGFYLNSYSPRASELKQTKLFKMFARAAAICDPSALEATGDALICNHDTDRH